MIIPPTCSEGQPFSANYNPFYKAGGLLGHTGVDISCGYGSPIAALASGFVYSTFPIERPASYGYTAVITICETPLEVFEMTYGHVSEIDCQIGQQVKVGDLIAKEGNHGQVYSGNILITQDMQAAGDHRGSHVHYQKRPVLKVDHTTPNGRYLQTAEGIYYDGSHYYEIYEFDNGFNGCVNWDVPLFPRDLYFGTEGYDVYLLQRALVNAGLLHIEDCIGTFGPKTMRAAAQFQKQNNLAPALGYIGPKTRAVLNSTYGQLV